MQFSAFLQMLRHLVFALYLTDKRLSSSYFLLFIWGCPSAALRVLPFRGSLSARPCGASRPLVWPFGPPLQASQPAAPSGPVGPIRPLPLIHSPFSRYGSHRPKSTPRFYSVAPTDLNPLPVSTLWPPQTQIHSPFLLCDRHRPKSTLRFCSVAPTDLNPLSVSTLWLPQT